MAKRQLGESSSEFDDHVSWQRRKLSHDMTVSLPQDMVDVITDMAIDTHEKDLTLPTMSKFLWWNSHWLNYPAFELPSHIFQPKWLDAGLVSCQIIDLADDQNIQQLPAVVKYVMFKYANKTRYSFVDITSTLMERPRDNPLKVYYPYQIWKILPSFHEAGEISVRPPPEVEEENRRWESYWSHPLKSRVDRVKAFVTQLVEVLTYNEFWIFFDGRRVVVIPKSWVHSEEVDTSKLGTEGCQRLLRQFWEDPESLDLPSKVRAQPFLTLSDLYHYSLFRN